jgi:hypothetical protein
LLELDFKNEFLEASMRNVPVRSVAIAKAITYEDSYFWDPVVFRSTFNGNREPLTLNQAWSLFLTIGQGDKDLGLNPEAGRFLLNVLIAVGVTGMVWSLIFNHSL